MIDAAAPAPVAVATFGMAQIKGDIAAVLGRPVVYRPAFAAFDAGAIAGWGRKPTARQARCAARLFGIPYIALEDGFLRSIAPGRAEPALSYVVDPDGIYYDASAPSRLERLIAEASTADAARALAGMAFLRGNRLSKYNNGPVLSLARLGLAPHRRRVLVLDQTFADASVAGAGAKPDDFARMLAAARAENSGADIVVKIHPETVAGRKRGYLARLDGVSVIDALVNPWSLIEAAERVYTVSSLMGFEALMAGREVVCFGAPFYAGWGLTDDRALVPARRGRASLERIFAAAYMRYATYLDPYRRRPIAFEEAADLLAFLTARHAENRRTVCLGITPWKQRAVRAMLAGAGGAPVFAGSAPQAIAAARRADARLIVWAAKEEPSLAAECAAAGVSLERMEDGFLRSVGLGAKLVPPASLIVDAHGIYYDPTRPSGFERIVETADFDKLLVGRAERLRQAIVAKQLSKYNEGEPRTLDMEPGRRVVLVPGQVEDDASIRLGARTVATNLGLLEAARARHPDAVIVFKPHPDIAAGLRRGRVAPDDVRRLADHEAAGWAMPALLDRVDHVETMTSLTGFEALIRGKTVTVHGQPFYAGWGLTEDLDPIPRRARRLSLDELVAAALILYPRYIDPVTGRPCAPELVVARFAEMLARPARARDRPFRRARDIYAGFVHRAILPAWRRIKAR